MDKPDRNGGIFIRKVYRLPLGRLTKGEYNTKMDHKELWRNVMDYIKLATGTLRCVLFV
jgi:hypothetical protein